MILSTILNHFRLKRRIRESADDLERQFDDPVVEAKMRAFCECNARQVHFWSRVARELAEREENKPLPRTPFTIARDAMLKREKDKRDGSAA